MLIIFDLDDTLIETSLGVTSVLLDRFKKRLIDLGIQEDETAIGERFWKYYYECSSSQVAARLVLGSHPGLEKKALESALDIFQHPDISDIEIAPIKGALDLLTNLKGQCSIALCTRGDPQLQRLKMKKSGIEPDFFDKICVGLEDKGIYYQEILDHFKIDAGSVSRSAIVCGDKVLFDLVPAKKLGCATIQFLRPFRNVEEQLSSFVDHQIKTLNDFLPIVQEQQVWSIK